MVLYHLGSDVLLPIVLHANLGLTNLAVNPVEFFWQLQGIISCDELRLRMRTGAGGTGAGATEPGEEGLGEHGLWEQGPGEQGPGE